MIYMDNGATMPMKECAVQELYRCIQAVSFNPSAEYRPAMKARNEIYISRNEIAECIGADASEIIFTSSGSEANSLTLQGCVKMLSKKGNHLIVSSIEHASVLKNVKQLEKAGFSVTYIHPDNDGIIAVKDIENAIRPETILVSVMYANNEIGSIQPIREIGMLLREKGIVFHTDAVSAAGYLDIDVERDGIDIMSVSGHKFGGPMGTGFLYKRNTVALEPYILGGDQENGYRAGTENVAGIAAMRAAFVDACQHRLENNRILQANQKTMLELFKKEIPGIVINGSEEKRLPGNVHVSINGMSADRMLMYLDMEGICASIGAACMNRKQQPSYVLEEIGAKERGSNSLRFTLSAEHTQSEIEFVVAVIKKYLPACAEK